MTAEEDLFRNDNREGVKGIGEREDVSHMPRFVLMILTRVNVMRAAERMDDDIEFLGKFFLF